MRVDRPPHATTIVAVHLAPASSTTAAFASGIATPAFTAGQQAAEWANTTSAGTPKIIEATGRPKGRNALLLHRYADAPATFAAVALTRTQQHSFVSQRIHARD